MKKNAKKLRALKTAFAVVIAIVICIANWDSIPDYINYALQNIGIFDSHTPVDGTLEVHIIDVGQGDSILVRSDEAVLLVDAGTSESKYTIENYLKAQGISKIDCFICTHPHADHIGSAEYIVRNFTIGNVMMCESDSSSQYLKRLLEAIDETNTNLTAAEYNTECTLGDMVFKILAPSPELDMASNNGSIVLRIEWGNTAFMLTGDAEIKSEKAILENFSAYELKSNVLKLGHHGSSTSSSKDFLAAVSPEWVAISCGRDNEYGHPHYEVLERLWSMGISDDKIMRTDEDGNIIFVSDGERVYLFGQE